MSSPSQRPFLRTDRVARRTSVFDDSPRSEVPRGFVTGRPVLNGCESKTCLGAPSGVKTHPKPETRKPKTRWSCLNRTHVEASVQSLKNRPIEWNMAPSAGRYTFWWPMKAIERSDEGDVFGSLNGRFRLFFRLYTSSQGGSQKFGCPSRDAGFLPKNAICTNSGRLPQMRLSGRSWTRANLHPLFKEVRYYPINPICLFM